jgi:hypothetical protein
MLIVYIYWEITYLNTTKKNKETLINDRREVGLEINAEKT